MATATPRAPGDVSGSDGNGSGAPVAGLPPGPRAPALAQTLAWALAPTWLMDRCARRLGDAFTLTLAPSGLKLVLVSDPDAVKAVFTAAPELAPSAAGSSPVAPIMGPSSVIVLTGPEHMRQRKLLLPPFHGERMREYEAVIVAATASDMASWPMGEPMSLQKRTRAITLEVILRAVFGVEAERMAPLRSAIADLLEPMHTLALLRVALRRSGFGNTTGAIASAMQRLDEVIHAEIANRRGQDDLEAREDILSLLMQARDEDGQPMTDGELRDELVTLLLAGHETTATAVAWAVERLVRHPDKLERLVAELDEGSGDEYLMAVVNETLRVRPVVPIVVRLLTGELEVGCHLLPAGTRVAPCIYLTNRNPSVYERPAEFRPERFLDGGPETFSWIPFGGGIRRCIGASFAQLEMKLMLRTSSPSWRPAGRRRSDGAMASGSAGGRSRSSRRRVRRSCGSAGGRRVPAEARGSFPGMEMSTVEAARARDGDRRPEPEELLARFGLDSFRPGQREAVQAALEGRDSLVVMPTGGGKSLCYQLPALVEEGGLVVVVSPLIALMSDQWRRLREAGVRSTMLASGMQEGHNVQALREIESGSVQLVLAAPERFASGAFREALSRRRVDLFVVDEAHCVTEWGHDFRPDYLRLHEAIGSLGQGHGAAGRPAVMAATATATPRVAEEIAARLGLRDWVSIRSGFDRPNLTFDVVSVEGKGALARKRAALMHVLESPDARPAIVYCGTRKDTEEVSGRIASAGISSVVYHAGMAAEERRESQAAFMEGRAEVVVATNAFGMGVDKADVRTVAHWALPTSLEAYYQEAGRGGRDGEPARALLLASRMDLGRLIRFIKERETTVEDVRRYVGHMRAGSEGEELSIGHGELGERQRVLLSIAERAGAVELEPGGREGLLVRLTGRGSPRMAQQAIRQARDRSWESYRSIERFSAEAEVCRRRQILDHFGDPEQCRPTGRCCDVCDPDEALVRAVQAPVVKEPKRGGGGRPRGASQAPEGPPVDAGEFERLRAWRMGRAEGKPAFTVAADSVLAELLRRRPRTVEELIEIKGIGPAFCEKHGDSLLETLASLG